MIVNFRLFENENKYNIGDYILIDGSYFKDDSSKFAKISDIDNETSMTWYTIIFIINNKIDDMFISNDMIVRKLNSDEIEAFELEYNTMKYNI